MVVEIWLWQLQQWNNMLGRWSFNPKRIFKSNWNLIIQCIKPWKNNTSGFNQEKDVYQSLPLSGRAKASINYTIYITNSSALMSIFLFRNLIKGGKSSLECYWRVITGQIRNYRDFLWIRQFMWRMLRTWINSIWTARKWPVYRITSLKNKVCERS